MSHAFQLPCASPSTTYYCQQVPNNRLCSRKHDQREHDWLIDGRGSTVSGSQTEVCSYLICEANWANKVFHPGRILRMTMVNVGKVLPSIQVARYTKTNYKWVGVNEWCLTFPVLCVVRNTLFFCSVRHHSPSAANITLLPPNCPVVQALWQIMYVATLQSPLVPYQFKGYVKL